MEIIGEFVALIQERSLSQLPTGVAHEARRSLLNVLGTSIGASQTAEVDALIDIGKDLGIPEVSIPGRGETLHRNAAASVIGFAAHLDDFDDTHPICLIHPSAPTLGAVYALALLEGFDASRSLLAFALGIESQLRVGLAMTPSHYDTGWHITGTCGVIGAAVTASILAGYDENMLRGAIVLSANMTLGHREAFGTPIKPFHAGYAASNGLLAAALAPLGFAEHGIALEDKGGYFGALSEEWDPSLLERGKAGSDWILLENTYKAFPCGVVAHPAIEAAIELHSQLGPSPSKEITKIRVRCHPLVVELMGRPTATTGLDARFCAAHGVAAGLIDGTVGLPQFSDEKAVNKEVEMLRSVTELLPDINMHLDAATVIVERANGQDLVCDIDSVIGGSSRPLSDVQLLAKFEALVEPILPGRSKELAAAVFSLGDSSSFGDIVRLSRKWG